MYVTCYVCYNIIHYVIVYTINSYYICVRPGIRKRVGSSYYA